MNKIIKQELIKAGVTFNDNDTHILINKMNIIDSKFTKEDQCYIIEYIGNTYKVEIQHKYDDGVLVDGILFKDGEDIYLEHIYKKLLFNEFKVISKI